MSVSVAAGTHHTYKANGHDTLLSEVQAVLCAILPRAVLIAGLNDGGSVVMARYNNYPSTSPEWDAAFFEHELMTEMLFGVPQQVKAVFIGSGTELLIPMALYSEPAAREWMAALHATCPDDVIRSWPAASAAAQYCFALPQKMDRLLRRYFGDTPVLPVAAYQLYKPPVGVHHLLQCLIGQDAAIASLHQAGALQWHRSFPYDTVEDIAWQMAHLCRELHIPRIDLQVECAMLCDTCYELGPELERYFPKIKWSAGSAVDGGEWAPVLYLLQQLYACAL